MNYTFIAITPAIQKDINRQFRATIARDKRLMTKHRAGLHRGQVPSVNCPKCRVENQNQNY